MFALRKISTSVPKTVCSTFGRYISWTGKAAENTIDLTFITPKGESKTVKARIGDSVLETAKVNDLPVCGDCNATGLPLAVKRTENWTEETFGEGIGPSCSFCHVVLSTELFNVVPKAKPEEQAWIDKVPIGKEKRSRLACQLKVSQEMDGGVIYIPHHVPNDLL